MLNYAQERYANFGNFDLSAHEDPESSSTNMIGKVNYTTKVNITNDGTPKVGTIRKVPEDTTKKLNAERIKQLNPAIFNILDRPDIYGNSLGACIRSVGGLITKYNDVKVIEGFNGQSNPSEFLEVKLKYFIA